MAPAVRERVFEPFFTTRPPGKGTGLGLSVVHRIIQDHGGAILVESTPGTGSRFRVYLPWAAELSEGGAAPEAAGSCPAASEPPDRG